MKTRSSFIYLYIYCIVTPCVLCLTKYFPDESNLVEPFISAIHKNDTVLFSNVSLARMGFKTSAGDNLDLSPSHIIYSGIEPCRDKGECFSGAWFSKTEHLTSSLDLESFFQPGKRKGMLRRAYCEDASNWLMHKMLRHFGGNYRWGDLPGQTVDVLDFSGERLIHKHPEIRMHKSSDVAKILDSFGKFYNPGNEAEIRQLHLSGSVNASTSTSNSTSRDNMQDKFDSTIVLIPMLIRHKGLGHSDRSFRERYLNLTVWSLRPIFKTIVAYVKDKKDYDFVLNESKLPFSEVIFLQDVPDCALPIAAVLDAKKKLSQGVWKFDFIYFTEADQILFARNLFPLYRWMDMNPHGILTPHRLVLMPRKFLEFQNKSLDNIPELTVNSLPFQRCCMDTGSHGETRVHWKPLTSRVVNPVNVHGVYVILGNSNMFSQIYRTCNVTASSSSMQTCSWATKYTDFGPYDQSDKHFSN